MVRSFEIWVIKRVIDCFSSSVSNFHFMNLGEDIHRDIKTVINILDKFEK